MFGFGKRGFSSFERGLLEHVEKAGCHINGVFDPDGDEPIFCYSVGFPTTVAQDEVIMFGLDGNMMGHAINEVLRRCRDEGLVLKDGLVLSGFLADHDLILKRIPSNRITAEFFNSAIWYSENILGRPMTGAFQIVWPGADDGRFPWDPRCEPDVVDAQPALYDTAVQL